TAKGPGLGLAATWQIRVIAAGLKLSATRLGLPLNKRYALRASFADEAGAVIGPATGVTFASDNPQIAAVGEDGTVTAAGYGHARITASAPGGKRAAVAVFVQGEIVLASSRSGRLQLYSAERSNLAQLRKVLDDSSTATDPAYSPDGSRIAFVSTRDGQPEIYVMDADGTDVARLTNSPGVDGDPSFTADGQAVVFHSNRTGHRQIFVQAITGSDAIQLTQEPADNSQPSVSPDGESIAFVSSRDGSDDVWLMSRDGSNQHNLTKSQQLKERSPHFLRDGSLAFLLEGKDGGRTVTQVVKMDLATGRMAPVTGTDLVIGDFAVSPAGDLLALVVNVQKNVSRVYIQPVGTGGGSGRRRRRGRPLRQAWRPRHDQPRRLRLHLRVLPGRRAFAVCELPSARRARRGDAVRVDRPPRAESRHHPDSDAAAQLGRSRRVLARDAD